MTAAKDQGEHDARQDARAAAILARRASGLLAPDEALTELADSDCEAAIAALIAERVRLEPAVALRALRADEDQAISVICRAAGFRINGYSAVLRMRRRHGHGTGGSPTDALTFFSGLSRASAERIVQQLAALNPPCRVD